MTERPTGEQRSAVERHFWLVRDEDVSGVSGTGRVAEAFVFEDGTAALRWLTQHRSTAIYASAGELEAIHGHNGSTRLVPATEPAAPDTEPPMTPIQRAQAGPPPLDARNFGRVFGEVMKLHPKADVRLVNDILRAVARLSRGGPER